MSEYQPLTYAYSIPDERVIFNRECQRLTAKGVDYKVVEFAPPVSLREDYVACEPGEYVEIWTRNEEN